MKYEVKEKERRIGLQQAIREHRLIWGRFKFIHAGYLPMRFRNQRT